MNSLVIIAEKMIILDAIMRGYLVHDNDDDALCSSTFWHGISGSCHFLHCGELAPVPPSCFCESLLLAHYSRRDYYPVHDNAMF